MSSFVLHILMKSPRASDTKDDYDEKNGREIETSTSWRRPYCRRVWKKRKNNFILQSSSAYKCK